MGGPIPGTKHTIDITLYLGTLSCVACMSCNISRAIRRVWQSSESRYRHVQHIIRYAASIRGFQILMTYVPWRHPPYVRGIGGDELPWVVEAKANSQKSLLWWQLCILVVVLGVNIFVHWSSKRRQNLISFGGRGRGGREMSCQGL